MAGGSTATESSLTFASDTKSDYVDDYIVFYEIQTADAGTAKAVVVWFGRGSATVPSHGISVEVVEVDISMLDSLQEMSSNDATVTDNQRRFRS